MIYKNKNIFENKYFATLDTNDLSSFLSDEIYKLSWFGVSFQLEDNKKTNNKEIVQFYQDAFNDVIENFNIDKWYIQPFQPITMFPWFDDFNYCKEFQKINSLSNISLIKFKGYIQVNQFQIKDMFDELFYFSFKTNSQDLIIFNVVKSFVIILGQHLTIDIITTEKIIMEEFIQKLAKYNFIVKKYK